MQNTSDEQVISDESDTDEWAPSDHTNIDGTHIHINGTTMCTCDEYPDLYAEMEVLISGHLELDCELDSAGYGNPDWNESIVRANSYYYLLTEKNSLSEVREDLAQVYTDDYIDSKLAPHIFNLPSPKLWEEDGKLYGVNADGVSQGLEEDWTIFKVTDTRYYVQAYKDLSLVGGDTLSIFTVLRTDEGLRISDLIEINF